MAILQDVYCKFGEVAGAAQLLETELGNIGLLLDAAKHDLIESWDPARAGALLDSINRRTLGQAIKHLGAKEEPFADLPVKLERALAERNRPAHSFYREHNFRRNSEQGQRMMLDDLESMHTTILGAYKLVLLLVGVDIDALVRDDTKNEPLPAGHLLF